MNDKYNGYTNYETWVTKLWIDNELDSSQEYWLERAKRNDAYSLATELQDYFEEIAENKGLLEAGLFSDLFLHALGKVNWDEIASILIEDAKEILDV